MSSVPMMVESAMAVNMESMGNPFAAKGVNMEGSSARIYDMVMKVVIPERISAFRLCRCVEKPTSEKSFSFIIINS